MRKPKKERQKHLVQLMEKNPFLTDEELSEKYGVSVQTIRLDRLECGIPELRKRLKQVASQTMAKRVKSLHADEVIGDIIDLSLDERAISIFDVKEEHVFQRNGITRGHHLFAQANSLAVAVIGENIALTTTSTVHFLKSVKVDTRVVARAEVREKQPFAKRTIVDVVSTVDGEEVFTGEFHMFKTTEMKRGNER